MKENERDYELDYVVLNQYHSKYYINEPTIKIMKSISTRIPERVRSPIDSGIRYTRVTIVDRAGIRMSRALIQVSFDEPCKTSIRFNITVDGRGFCKVTSITYVSPFTQIVFCIVFVWVFDFLKEGRKRNVLLVWRERLLKNDK